MTYDVIFVEKEDSRGGGRGAKKRAGGESIFLASLPTSPKVFAFFYPGDVDTDEAERRLRALGQRTGDNLFVNIGSLVDPDYKRAVQRFGIGPLPVIVVTAVSPLAATPDGETAFVRLDGKSLFAKPEELVRTVEELFNLFLGGKIVQAVMSAWTKEGMATLVAAAEQVWAVIQPVITWVARKDIKLEFAGAKIEVKQSEAP